MTSFPKDTPVLLPHYLAYCREEPCAFCGRFPAGEAHHTRVKGMGCATVRDDLAVPACRRCHMRCHGLTVDGKSPIPRHVQESAARAAQERYQKRCGTPGDAVPF